MRKKVQRTKTFKPLITAWYFLGNAAVAGVLSYLTYKPDLATAILVGILGGLTGSGTNVFTFLQTTKAKESK